MLCPLLLVPPPHTHTHTRARAHTQGAVEAHMLAKLQAAGEAEMLEEAIKHEKELASMCAER